MLFIIELIRVKQYIDIIIKVCLTNKKSIISNWKINASKILQSFNFLSFCDVVATSRPSIYIQP